MKLFDLLHNVVDGMGQGQVAPTVPWGSKRAKPIPISGSYGLQALRHVTKVMVQNSGNGRSKSDLCWLLADADDKIVFVMQSDKTLDDGFLGWICKSPGFDKVAIGRAMRSKRSARYTVWQRDIIAEKMSKRR